MFHHRLISRSRIRILNGFWWLSVRRITEVIKTTPAVLSPTPGEADAFYTTLNDHHAYCEMTEEFADAIDWLADLEK